MEQDDYVFEWAMKNPIPATKNNSIVDTISAMEFYFLALKPPILMVFRVFFSFINTKSAILHPNKARMADVLSFKECNRSHN